MRVQRAHLLTVRTTVDFCRDRDRCERWDSADLPCRGHQDISHTLECPYPHGELGAPDRPCSMYRQCDCRLDDEQRDELYNSIVAPCPTSPTGLHYDVGNPDIFPAAPVTGCWAQWADCRNDHVEDFRSRFGDGVWVVTTHSSSPECESGVDFQPIARIEE